MENQLKHIDEMQQIKSKFDKEMQAVTTARSALRDEVYKDGVLS